MKAFIMNNDVLFLFSEINELEALLALILEGRLIDRMSLEARLASSAMRWLR